MPDGAQLDDGPIVARTTPALRFPAVAHVCGAARHDQIVPISKEHITARKNQPAVFHCRKIDLAAELFQAIPVGKNLAIDSQTRYAAIRINLKTKIGPTISVGNSKRIQ